MKSSIVINFDKAIRTATLSMENWNSDNTINWSFVESDVYMDISKYYNTSEVDAIMESDFDAYAEETEDWMKNCGVNTFEKFEYLTLL
tara:strand:- start:974 stop:1237 length:264 start_codon:yes stop_codon:yes gene_type:complete